MQSLLNAQEWSSGGHVADYDNRVLTPVEVQIFVRYSGHLSGRVLDLGCGAGRVLAYLVMLGAEAHGIDLAPRMVERCRRAVPQADVRVGDIAELDACVEGQFDAILAADNLLDVFGDAERRLVLTGIRRHIAPGGLFIFSGHDLGYLDSNPGPREWEITQRRDLMRKLAEASAADLMRAIARRRRTARNRRRLAPLEQRHADHAIVNDFPHDYGLLHYYIRRDDQERQLGELGFELVECLTADGRQLAPGGTGPTDSLTYVARPA